MYKVFVNEKKISFSNFPEKDKKNILFEDNYTFEVAIDMLLNTSCKSINVYGEDLLEIWSRFKNSLKVIEAAGGIIMNNKDEILFIKRLGKWDLPKGKIEKGESKENAALREVNEETGLSNLELQKFINTTYHIYFERDKDKVLKTTYWYSMKFHGTEQPIPQREEGITEIEWKDKNSINIDVFPNTFKNIELILNEYFMD